MADMRSLMSLEDWENTLRKSSEKPQLIFKHSTQCPISAGAYEELTQYMARSAGEEADFSIVRVIEERPVSNAIAEALGVTHKSPQAILVKEGQPVWDESHWRITQSFLNEKFGESGVSEA
ncbi:bacillithiol system redox-active protein YtxJ [Cohnella lubricantis]|uniref:Bacillithiol system redox-active protein YtxJ n=1 Tax=Cohnella lubricantis TaxID=2163172 RepID=A0A841TB36_9BACL|nr:bacillithiol system redox-active protein YtxJ [Cohnella lubricantis]MBB6677249.1 bacillithiol system redox-active protein YtxJ [Cohnella lubricantis]MBP2116940.1 bacillithiol system protein YtxJ [Cohnella lubricantis]